MSAAKSIAGESKNCCILAYTRWTHAIAHPPPLDSAISRSAILPPLVLPEFEKNLDTINNQFGSGFHIGSGSMELMAVPKKKTSPHKRGIRNGPRALKPIPVIIRCKVCGRVKLPHFFCCSGLRDTNGQNDSTNWSHFHFNLNSNTHNRLRIRCDMRLFISFLFEIWYYHLILIFVVFFSFSWLIF